MFMCRLVRDLFRKYLYRYGFWKNREELVRRHNYEQQRLHGRGFRLALNSFADMVCESAPIVKNSSEL